MKMLHSIMQASNSGVVVLKVSVFSAVRTCSGRVYIVINAF